MKPYYDKDGIVIYHGDCREVLPEIGRGKNDIGVIITDPPYNVGCEYESYEDDLREEEYFALIRLEARRNKLHEIIAAYPVPLALLEANAAELEAALAQLEQGRSDAK